jgi:thiol-disulfide isomerase/thioredoxin
MQLTKTDQLPFEILVNEHSGSFQLTVINGEEEIVLSKPKKIVGDSLEVEFPYFRSILRFQIHSKKEIRGSWYNLYKKNYRIPFVAKFNPKKLRFSHIPVKAERSFFKGKWEVHFEPGTSGTYPAVGMFEQDDKKNSLTGTFLTETGDYRYLSGNATKDSLYLSCFDGSHAFLLKAAFQNDSLYGTFYSGNHWSSEWIGFKNDLFELKSPEELTYPTNQPLQFELQTLDGSTYSYPNKDLEGKVVIIQIMGSWCPNCLDESHYYKQLYNNYHDKGLEILSVGYEIGDSFDDHKANILKLKEKLNLEFTFLVGGNAKKALASEHFSALNEVISFPTSIYIGRDGTIRRVHTGFNGPGTGQLYKDYVQQTNALIESLLAE